ncbi:hypothetical protein Gogos_017517 [Gossypium gossypioides]|uniref:Uncharacterized protein n=1 Tax=Gossypium gossypioides TaxID=34282 RepID=A0A7J9BAY4_GOSGO|nr:hypothetical protein [Gossypium gossypioides]
MWNANFLQNQHRLVSVDMSRNQLNRALLPSWLLENNTDLKLGNDEFTGGLITKKELIYAGMETFDVSNNKMTGNNHFSGLIPRQLCQLRDIRIIDFCNNSFSGSIPSCLSNFDSEIGSAHAVGLIYSFSWSEAGYDFVKSLRELYDSRSLMDSVLLEDKAIDALNLSHNHLTRLIPVSLSNLSQLESRVPGKGQFATFDINSYEGNPFLYGLPSEKNHTKVVETPLPSIETEEKWYEIDRTLLLILFAS